MLWSVRYVTKMKTTVQRSMPIRTHDLGCSLICVDPHMMLNYDVTLCGTGKPLITEPVSNPAPYRFVRFLARNYARDGAVLNYLNVI